jgi:hypothetical protein
MLGVQRCTLSRDKSVGPRQVYSFSSLNPTQTGEFNKLDDYFAKPLYSHLATSDLTFSRPECRQVALNLRNPLVLLTTDSKAALTKWSTTADDIALLWVKLGTLEDANSQEQNSKCLREASRATDEVTAEVLFAMEKLQVSILPTTNTYKRSLQRRCEQEPVRFNREELKTIKAQCFLVTQWGFIYRSLKKGLAEKYFQDYEDQAYKFKSGDDIVEADCCVCFSLQEEDQQLNPMHYCQTCKLWVHRACFGLWRAGEFECQTCQGSQACWICGWTKGMLRKDSETGKWFHLSCALWDSEQVDFADWHQLSSLRVLKSRSSDKCYICQRPDGLLTQCKECTFKAHLMCAWVSGLSFQTEDSSRNPHFQYASRPVRRVKVSFICNKHPSDNDPRLQQKLRYYPLKHHIKELKAKAKMHVPPTKKLRVSIVKS